MRISLNKKQKITFKNINMVRIKTEQGERSTKSITDSIEIEPYWLFEIKAVLDLTDEIQFNKKTPSYKFKT